MHTLYVRELDIQRHTCIFVQVQKKRLHRHICVCRQVHVNVHLHVLVRLYISMTFSYLWVCLCVCLWCVRMYITHVYPICVYTYIHQEELLACEAACQKAGDTLLKSTRPSA